ncbi:MAG: HNH endonuclease, partial [Spirochaetaceae bacterium]|nr:HNH endonuclease [Spirochaetaceae bacterium]
PAPVAGPVLDAAAREKLVKQAAGKSTREVQQMLAEVDPELAQPSDRMRALGSGRWELKAAIDAECRHGLEKLQMLLSHQDPHLTLGGLVTRLVSDGLDRYDPARPPRARRTGGRGSVEGGESASKPARRHAEAVRRNMVRAKGSDVERRSEVDRDDTSLAADRVGNSRPSAPRRHTQAECDNTNSAPVRDGGGRTDSAAKRASEAEHDSSSLVAVPSSGEHTTSAAKRQAQAAGCIGDAEKPGVLDRATCAAGPQIEADRCNRSRAPARGGRQFPTSAAKLIAYAAGHAGAERSAAVERHLSALSSFRGLPGSRSRYIPAAVRREVWRRDQGCCTYVDPHSGRRCGSRYRLEIDHIKPFALGGATELSNVRLRCRAHHKLRHAHTDSVRTEARRGPDSDVDPVKRERTVASHPAIDRAST